MFYISPKIRKKKIADRQTDFPDIEKAKEGSRVDLRSKQELPSTKGINETPKAQITEEKINTFNVRQIYY